MAAAALGPNQILIPMAAPECTDLDQLDAWVRRAVTVTRAEDLFA